MRWSNGGGEFSRCFWIRVGPVDPPKVGHVKLKMRRKTVWVVCGFVCLVFCFYGSPLATNGLKPLHHMDLFTVDVPLEL